jgi:CubicO group peptidase (beta-lactamase class C family)
MKRTTLSRPARGLVLLVSLFLAACGGGGGKGSAPPNIPPPAAYTYAPPAGQADGWSVASAAEQGMAIAGLETMMNDIRAGQYPNIDAVVIARNGALVFDETIRTTTDEEDRRVGNADPDVHTQFSATKSITSLVVGIAIDEGYIDGVDTPYLGLFPYTDYENWDERKSDITLHHVLAMQLGLAWNEWDPPYFSPDNQLLRFYANEVDYSKALLDLPLAAAPGTRFAYNTAATISLGQAVENSVPMSLIDFGASELMGPLGITDIELLTTPTGLPNSGGGFYFRTRDMVKFGQLLLNAGTWNGNRVVSEEWITESLASRTDISWNNPDNWDWQIDGYGYQWWLGHYDHEGVQLDTYVAWGYGGQWLVVIPSLQLVVAVNSHGYDGSDAALNEAHAIIRRYVLGAATGQ